MALYQDNNREIRYLNNTQREQKIIGNYYRDIIRQYGVNVNYYKSSLPNMDTFKPIIDENTIIRHAYGYDDSIDYSLSTTMIAYMEVQDDLLSLDKYGIIPNTSVNFWFDRIDFACALAQKLGQIKEYKIKPMEIKMEVPPPNGDTTKYFIYINQNNIKYIDESEVPESDRWESENIYTYELSDNIFPYAASFGNSNEFHTDIFKGKFNAVIGDYVLDEEKTVTCQILEHDSVEIKLPTNEYTASSFKRNITNDSFLDIILFLTFKVSEENGKYILRGKIHGGALFNDIYKIGKYMDLIHPDVGDIVTIGFPNEGSRQQYEITDCTDKKITNDGINPLLGQYVWLCKAKRYVPNGEDFPEINEDNQRIDEKIDILNNIDEIIARDIASYDEDENDDVYGGYDRELKPYDKRKVDYHKSELTDFEDDGSFLEIFAFYDNSKLVTDGYDLYYITSKNEAFKMTTVYDEINEKYKPSSPKYGNQYLKSTDNAVYFINFDNKSCKLCEDSEITKGEVEMCLNSLVDTTYQIEDNNKTGQYFYKFRESKTILLSLNDNLYCRFGNKNSGVVRLAGSFS